MTVDNTSEKLNDLGFFRGIIHEIDIDCAFTFA